MKFTIFIEEAKTLKEKKRVIRSFVDSVRNKFQISVSEVELLEEVNHSVIGCASVSDSAVFLSRLADSIEEYAHSRYPGRIKNIEKLIENDE